MPVDATYQSVVQIRQDGNAYVPTGKAIEVEAGGHFAMPVESGTSAASFTNYGVTVFGATASASYQLAAPSRAGLVKVLVHTVHGATTVANTVTATGAKILGGSTVVGGTSVLTFLSVANISLVSTSTAAWAVMSQPSANISFS
jgi:hypothetical protein